MRSAKKESSIDIIYFQPPKGFFQMCKILLQLNPVGFPSWKCLIRNPRSARYTSASHRLYCVPYDLQILAKRLNLNLPHSKCLLLLLSRLYDPVCNMKCYFVVNNSEQSKILLIFKALTFCGFTKFFLENLLMNQFLFFRAKE